MNDLAQAVRGSERAKKGRGDQVAVRARKAGSADLAKLSDLLAGAFSEDPVFSWCYPDPGSRQGILPAVFRTFIDAYLPLDETYMTEDHVAGAVCAPPGGEPDEARLAALEEISGEYAPRALAVGELMAAEHPHEPHYYLFFLGTRPEFQSRGIGSALLAKLLEPCDRAGVPAYLDATSERNKRLYLRHGFEVSGEVRLPGGPPFWRMWREPR